MKASDVFLKKLTIQALQLQFMWFCSHRPTESMDTFYSCFKNNIFPPFSRENNIFLLWVLPIETLTTHLGKERKTTNKTVQSSHNVCSGRLTRTKMLIYQQSFCSLCSSCLLEWCPNIQRTSRISPSVVQLAKFTKVFKKYLMPTKVHYLFIYLFAFKAVAQELDFWIGSHI